VEASDRVSWGLFVVWLVHDTEEVLTATWWSERATARLRADGWPTWFVENVAVSTSQFAVAAAVVGVAVLLLARLGARTGARSPVFQAGVLVFGWHGAVHIGQAVVLRDYVPGLVGAVLLVVPYAVWAWRTTGRMEPVRRPPARVVVAVAAAALALTVAAQALAGLLLG
jgi:hypothetical protein